MTKHSNDDDALTEKTILEVLRLIGGETITAHDPNKTISQRALVTITEVRRTTYAVNNITARQTNHILNKHTMPHDANAREANVTIDYITPTIVGLDDETLILEAEMEHTPRNTRHTPSTKSDEEGEESLQSLLDHILKDTKPDTNNPESFF